MACAAVLQKLPIVVVSAVAAAFFGAAQIASAQTSTVEQCRALVEVHNDLFLVSSDGLPILRFASDGKPKQSISLAPNGRRVAYLLADEQQTFRIAANTKTNYSFSAADLAADRSDKALTLYQTAPLISVNWIDSYTIKLARHIGPTASRFEFYRVPPKSSHKLSEISKPSVGEICSVTPYGDHVACIQGSDIVIDNAVVYSANSAVPTSKASSIKLKVGSIEATNTDPNLRVQVTSLVGGANLLVNLPTGTWVASRLTSKRAFLVTLEDKLFSFRPASIDLKRRLVRLDVTVEPQGAKSFERVIAWTRKGKEIVVIRRRDEETKLQLLRRSGRRLVGIASGLLNIAEPIHDLWFLTPSVIMYETNRGFGEAVLKVVTKRRGPPVIQIKQNILSRILSVKLDNATLKSPVRGWSCKK
jgi:hypothetical protein